MTDEPTGADQLIATAVHNGITTCFANPGTTELHLVKALDSEPGIRSVLCTFEGVCSGAADGFARMTGIPALGLFHLGPGFANSLANQHNARRHHAPMINIIGDQASWHLGVDAPLTSDIDALGNWAGLTRHTDGPDDLGPAMARAISDVIAGTPRQISLVVPADHAWGAARGNVVDAQPAPRPVANTATVAAVAAALRQDGATLIVGGESLSADAMRHLGQIRAATGCTVYTTRLARLEIGGDLPVAEELPYFPRPLRDRLANTTVAVLAGRTEPTTFFGYPDTPSRPLGDDVERIELCGENGDLEASLAAVVAQLGGDADTGRTRIAESLPEVDPGELTTTSLGVAIARSLVPGHIVVNESLTSGGTYRALAADAAPHTILGVNGGAIGGGLPTALGAAVACPDRPVLALQADGSALYTFQALWSMARERLDITVVICANRRYLILDVEFGNHDMTLSPAGRELTNLSNPDISYVALAEGFGVPGRSVTTGAELIEALDWANAEPGPHLIEAEL